MRTGIAVLCCGFFFINSCVFKDQARGIPFIEYHESGVIKSRGYLDATTKKKQGFWEIFDQNGKILCKGKYSEGFKDSVWIYFRYSDTICWTTYKDSILGVKLNVPKRFKAFPNYQNSKALVFVDSVESTGAHVNFNINKYLFNKDIEYLDRVIAISDLNSDELTQVSVNDKDIYVRDDKISSGSRDLFLSQAFINSGHALYLVNTFEPVQNGRLLDEILLTIEFDEY